MQHVFRRGLHLWVDGLERHVTLLQYLSDCLLRRLASLPLLGRSQSVIWTLGAQAGRGGQSGGSAECFDTLVMCSAIVVGTLRLLELDASWTEHAQPVAVRPLCCPIAAFRGLHTCTDTSAGHKSTE